MRRVKVVGAGSVGNHLGHACRGKGWHVTLCYLDPEALRQRLGLEGITPRWVEVDRPLIEKQRFMVGASKVMKLDLGDPITLAAGVLRTRFLPFLLLVAISKTGRYAVLLGAVEGLWP